MNQQQNTLWIHALSSVHAGVGQGSGVIDLPIAREKATEIPYIPGSSIKGVLRDMYKPNDKNERNEVFGPEIIQGTDDSYASAVNISDARLFCLAVRSLSGMFARVTCPYVLQRLNNDSGLNFPIPQPKDEQIILPKGSILSHNNSVILEDVQLQVEVSSELDQWLEYLKPVAIPQWRERLCVVSDNVFKFLVTTAIEVIARIRINQDSKTVAQGALWYEEALPAESVLYGIALYHASRSKNSALTAKHIQENLSKEFNTALVQLGGKATVGRGLCRLYFAGGK